MHMLVFCFFFSFIKENAKTFNFRLNLGSASPRCCITDSNNNPLTVFLHSVMFVQHVEEFFFFFKQFYFSQRQDSTSLSLPGSATDSATETDRTVEGFTLIYIMFLKLVSWEFLEER